MKTKINTISVDYYPRADNTKVKPIRFLIEPSENLSIPQIIKEAKKELKIRLKKKPGKTQKLIIEIKRKSIKPIKIDSKIKQWCYYYKNINTGHITIPKFIETRNRKEPNLEEIKKVSRLADFPERWELVVEQGNNIKINGKWMAPEIAESIQEQLKSIIITEMHYNNKIVREICNQGKKQTEIVNIEKEKTKKDTRFSFNVQQAS